MAKILDPLEGDRAGSRREKVLWLRGGGDPWRLRDDAFRMPAIVVFSRWNGEHEYPFVSRIVGVSPALDFKLERVMAHRVKNRDYGVSRMRSYESLSEGDYFATSMIVPPEGGDAMETVVLANYSSKRGFSILTLGQMAARWRGFVTPGFGDVRSLVASQDWQRAELAAHWIIDRRERETALHYLRQCHSRGLGASESYR